MLPAVDLVNLPYRVPRSDEADAIFSRLLARHQHVLDRLRREIESILGVGSSEQPTRVDLKKMTYLNLVLKEGESSFPQEMTRNSKRSASSIAPISISSREFSRVIKDDNAPNWGRRRWEVAYLSAPWRGSRILCVCNASTKRHIRP